MGCCEGQETSSQVPDVQQVTPCPIGPPPPSCPGGFLYGVQAGDSLFSIGQKFGLSIQTMIAANPQIPNPNVLFPGQVICVPTSPPPGYPPPPPPCVGGCLYGVQPGESLFTIAQKFGVSVQAMIAANPQIINPNFIVPSQVVCVPTGVPPGIVECCMLLFRTTVVAPPASGVAQVRVVPFEAANNILVATFGLPNPGSIGPGLGLTTYIAWARGTPIGTIKILLDESSITPGVWAGAFSSVIGSVAPFMDIIVTAEPNTMVNFPSGPVVLQGFFNNCR